MKCPKCSATDTHVKDSRDLVDTRRRRRQCDSCGHKFTTTEVHGIHSAGDFPLFKPDIIMRDGNNEAFDENKLRVSVENVCRHCKAIQSADIDQLLASLGTKVSESDNLTVTVDALIEWTITALAELDKIAAMRYAVQFMDFHTGAQIRKYLAKLEK